MMRDSMNQLGLEDEDLDYKKSLEDFKPKKGEPAQLDKIVTMRYNHYRDRCIETINRVLEKRRTIKERQKNMSMRLSHSNTKSAG